MSGWNNTAAAPANQDWDTSAASWNDGTLDAVAATGDDGFGADAAGDGGNNDRACRNCGLEGHFARDCTEPRKMGACFNCGQEGHSKADCTEPRKFKGECRNCNQEGHMASDCPTRVVTCKNCQQEGHVAIDCKNAKVLDNSRVAEKSEDEAWALLQQASEERDIGDFKEAVQILSKACPDYTYPQLEKEFRAREFSIYLIAMEKDHAAAGMETWTNVNLQGDIGKKYAVSYFLSDKPERLALVDKWPASAEENLARLADAGIPLNRGVEKCSNCNKLGHTARRCPDEKMASVQPVVACYLCGEQGHRVRDCAMERKSTSRACKICESEDHMAKVHLMSATLQTLLQPTNHVSVQDCPNKEKRTCRNCGEEDHKAADCPNPKKITCNNCGEEGHIRAECPMPRKKINWAEVTCSKCQQKGHGRARCPEADPGEKQVAGASGFDTVDSGADGGGWNAPANASSAPAEWEIAQPNTAAAGFADAGW
ncbi:hypothetical protein G647_04588 [Cladophialophora carrionii CBS 160.54]|uniref:CCHC-type domain-containing protein n=1 Tax=Cladophialophora carrionii CBS 160.54 TaxID=1279043 RepID=V9DED5_9EURO|nr:uncharacterized protein G647_04588 [Cladophialophora carrionii CBS 160.54]ETI25215.1 hypothetical protein G647_04588 [Cladophialophora carrionii CBS 160.54]